MKRIGLRIILAVIIAASLCAAIPFLVTMWVMCVIDKWNERTQNPK